MKSIDLVIKIGSMALIQREDGAIDHNIFQRLGDDLRPGMALTVEPGLYLRAAASVPEHLHGIGIRIEDDVFVTETGCEVYTTTPRTVADIEAVMRDRGNG